MIAGGIIDPAKVVRSGVQNAASIAGMVLTTEALVVEKPEPEAAAPGGMPGGMGWYGWHGRYAWNGWHGHDVILCP